MRKDFNKLLCEKSRKHDYQDKKNPDWDQKKELNKGRSDKLLYIPENYDEDSSEENNNQESHSWENLPSKDKRKGKKLNGKRLNENLSPLVRFLTSRVGKNWDIIYSEICENLRKDKAINLHVFQHLWGYVEKNTRIGPDSKLQYNAYGVWKDIRPSTYKYDYNKFYIHPETNVLYKWPFKRIKKKYDWRWFPFQKNPLKRFYLDPDNKWYLVLFKKIDPKEFGIEVVKVRFLDKNYLQPKKETEMVKQTIFEASPISDDIFFSDIKKIAYRPPYDTELLKRFWGDYVMAIESAVLTDKQVKDYNLEKIKQKEDRRPRRNPRCKE